MYSNYDYMLDIFYYISHPSDSGQRTVLVISVFNFVNVCMYQQ